MAPIAQENEKESAIHQTKQKELTSPSDTSKRAEKAQKMKEQLLNTQAQGSAAAKTKTATNASGDMSPEQKQNMENFFEWTPPPPPETMGQKLERKIKQNPLVPVGEYCCVIFFNFKIKFLVIMLM